MQYYYYYYTIIVDRSDYMYYVIMYNDIHCIMYSMYACLLCDMYVYVCSVCIQMHIFENMYTYTKVRLISRKYLAHVWLCARVRLCEDLID